MKLLILVAAVSILGSTLAKRSNQHEPISIVHKEAPWLDLPQPKIAGPGQFPWYVAIVINDSLFCSGSLVSRKWVMTAAHCVRNYHKLDLVIGSNQMVRTFAREVKIHPEYDFERQEKDLALVELIKEVTLTQTVNTIHLPKFSETAENFDGKQLFFTGWASADDKLSVWAGVSTPPLKWTTLKGASDSVCSAYYGSNFSPNKVCLDTTSCPYEEGVLTLAEGGTPIVFNDPVRGHTQIGVLSFGPGPSTLRPPVVALRVSSFLGWIERITGIAATTLVD